MSRKDYVRIARAFKLALEMSSATNPQQAAGVRLAANEVALALKADNGRFDRTRFLTACGVQS